MTISAVIFDMGGVLAHDVWEPLIFEANGSIAERYCIDKEKARSVGKLLWNEYAHIHIDDKNGWQELEINYWQRFIHELSLQVSVEELITLTDNFIRPVDQMLDLLEQLHSNNVRMSICSNNTDFWYARQRNKLGLGKYFPESRVILSSRIGVSKRSPHFEMFKASVNALKIEKANCLFIDDREENIFRSLAFGLPSILYPGHSCYGAEYLHKILKVANVF